MKLNSRRTILVGLAFLSICTFWQMYDSVMTLILTDTFKLNETFAGAIMAALLSPGTAHPKPGCEPVWFPSVHAPWHIL